MAANTLHKIPSPPGDSKPPTPSTKVTPSSIPGVVEASGGGGEVIARIIRSTTYSPYGASSDTEMSIVKNKM